jgi:hypothetical protein
MIIFGWGSNKKEIKIPDNKEQIIITTFSYFHIAWIWRVTFNRQWFLISRTINEKGESTTFEKVLSKYDAKQILSKDPTNLFWFIFNQSLIWFCIPVLIFSFVSGFFRPPQLSKQEVIAKVKTVDEAGYQKLLNDYQSDKKMRTKIEDYRKIYTKFPDIEKKFEENKNAFQSHFSERFDIEMYFSIAQDVDVRGFLNKSNPNQKILLTKSTVQSASKSLVVTTLKQESGESTYTNFQIMEKI